MGRDVDSIVRDLVEAALAMVREERAESVQVAAQRAAEDRLVDLLLPGRPDRRARGVAACPAPAAARGLAGGARGRAGGRRRPACPSLNLFGGQGMESLEMNLTGRARRDVHAGGARRK